MSLDGLRAERGLGSAGVPLAVDRYRVWAERALLGAVLLDPAGQQRVLDQVVPEDMRRPWHGQVLEAMRRVRVRGGLPEPMAVYQELQNDVDLPRGVAANAVLVADLMEAAPQARHAPVYAAMVVEGGIRQRLRETGARMLQAGGAGSLERLQRQAALSVRDLEACRARWMTVPEHLRRASSPGERAGDSGQAGRRPVCGREDAARPEGPAAVVAGERALRDLTAAPGRLTLVGRWLRPGHFASAEHGEVYALMREMSAAGRAVDPVTVSWEAARHGISVEPGSLDRGMGPFAVASAREVHRQGVLAQAAHAGRAIEADAADLACRPERTMQSAGQRLRTLMVQLEPGLVRAAASGAPGRGEAASGHRPRQAEREAV